MLLAISGKRKKILGLAPLLNLVAGKQFLQIIFSASAKRHIFFFCAIDK